MPSYANMLEKGIPIPTISNQSYGAVAQMSIDNEDEQENELYSEEGEQYDSIEAAQYEVPNVVYDYVDPHQV